MDKSQYKQALRGIDEFQLRSKNSKDKWYDITDKVPGKNDRVLCYTPSNKDSELGPYSVQSGWMVRHRNSGITHWKYIIGPEGEE